jgi:signal transduction histidine kinase
MPCTPHRMAIPSHLRLKMGLLCQSATSVLDDLLNLDKIENGSLSLEWSLLPIWDLIQRTAHEFSVPAMYKNIRLDIEFESPPIPRTYDNQRQDKSDIEHGIQSTTLTTVRSSSSSPFPRAARRLFVIGDMVRMSQVFRNLLSKCDCYCL